MNSFKISFKSGHKNSVEQPVCIQVSTPITPASHSTPHKAAFRKLILEWCPCKWTNNGGKWIQE